jgi:small conductance mechanosensitive channel
VLVGALNEKGVELIIRAWIENANFWPVYHANYQKLVETVSTNHINLPATTAQITLVNQPAQ